MNSTALGVDSVASNNGSTAIGYQATTTMNNQIVLGTSAETITAPGITSALSLSRQSGPIELVTSDANGNLATDGGSTITMINASAAANTAAIESNEMAIATNSDGISANGSAIATNANGISSNGSAIATNANNIVANSNRITTNNDSITNNTLAISGNTTSILQNVQAIDELTSGVAMAMALPDMYLNRDETYSIGGGVGFYEGKTAVSAGVMIRAGNNLSFGGSIAGNSDNVGGKLQARWGG
jgi:hypothetical protein